MIDLATLPEGFLIRTDKHVSAAALDRAARATGCAVPVSLRALFDERVLSLGDELTLFAEDLLDQYNVPPGSLPDEIAHPASNAEHLLAWVYSDHRLPGSDGMFFFASDNGGVLAFIDVRGRLGRGAGAVFAIRPGAGGFEHAGLVAPSFDAMFALVVEQWRTTQMIDLWELAELAR